MNSHHISAHSLRVLNWSLPIKKGFWGEATRPAVGLLRRHQLIMNAKVTVSYPGPDFDFPILFSAKKKEDDTEKAVEKEG